MPGQFHHFRAPRCAPERAAAPAIAGSPLAAFPALAHLLGAACFGQLAAAAAVRAAAAHVRPGAVVHSLLLQRDAPRPTGVPGRLTADVAALEWAIEEVTGLASISGAEPRLGADALSRLTPEAWQRAVLVPLRAFRLVPVAFRLASYVRRLHGTGRLPPPPRRGERHVLVAALPGRGEIPATAWWLGLPPPEGRLLAALALGTPLAFAAQDALARGAVADEAAVRALITAWLRDGLFTSLRLDD